MNLLCKKILIKEFKNNNIATLGSLLPKKQADMLTDKAKRMTKNDLERQAMLHPKSDLSYQDIDSLRNVAVARINNGDTVYTYGTHSFHSKHKSAQDPSTCSCF